MDKRKSGAKLKLVEPVEFSPGKRLETEVRREFLFLVGIAVVMLVAWAVFDRMR